MILECMVRFDHTLYLTFSRSFRHGCTMRKRNRGSAPSMTSLLHVALPKAEDFS